MADTEYGVNSSSPASPGFLGAIKDAVNAAGSYFRSQYKTRTDDENDQAIREGQERNAEDGVTRLDGHDTSP